METARIIHNGREVEVFKPEGMECYARIVDCKEAEELYKKKGNNNLCSIYGIDRGEFHYRAPTAKAFEDVTFGESQRSMYFIVFYYTLEAIEQSTCNIDELIKKKEEK